jgi:amidohydrolase
MVKEGVLDNPKVDVIFGQHIASGIETGKFTYRAGSVSAENDIFSITIKGKQSHGAAPWTGVDPIVTASQIVMGLQTIVSRNLPLPLNAAVVTVGSFHAGNRENIIPEDAVLTGTVRTLDTSMRNTIHQRMREVVEHIAASAGATAEVKISMEDAMLVNDPLLTAEMAPTLMAIAGNDKVSTVPAGMGAEDFAYFAQKVPGFYFSTGALPPGKKASEVLHHTPDFLVDESSFIHGVKALCHLTVNYMEAHATGK